MIPPNQGKPLLPGELEELEGLLASDIFRGESMQLDELQGLFFAVASSPEPIVPSIWKPEALGETPAFRDAEPSCCCWPFPPSRRRVSCN